MSAIASGPAWVHEFYIGDGQLSARTRREVLTIECDGFELALALCIIGRATCPFQSFTFVGDDAQTIAINWR